MTLFRYRRLLLLLLGLLFFSGLVSSILFSLGESISFFYSPADVVRTMDSEKEMRVGGIVKSIEKSGEAIKFSLSDGQANVEVVYDGILPALMRNGIEVVVVGKWKNGLLSARQVLVKHDERYYPQEKIDGSFSG